MKQPSLRSLGWVAGVALATLIGLGVSVAVYPAITRWEATVMLALHSQATPTLTRWVNRATDLGTVWGVLPATLGLVAIAFWQRHWRTGSYLALTLLGAMVLTSLAKQLGHRDRPMLWEGVPTLPDLSFPSGHATYSLALVLAVGLLTGHPHQRQWILALGSLFVLGIGLSRVYLGVHYPSDILGGWLLATTWTLGLYQVMFRR